MRLFAQFRRLVTPAKDNRQHSQDLPDEGGVVVASQPPETVVDDVKRLRVASLTPREHELYLLLLEGFTLKECAARLSIKYSTANTHINSIYKKLQVNSRAELIISYHTIQ